MAINGFISFLLIEINLESEVVMHPLNYHFSLTKSEKSGCLVHLAKKRKGCPLLELITDFEERRCRKIIKDKFVILFIYMLI